MSTDQALPATILADDAVAETPFYIPATGTATRPRRTLKYGDTFAVVDTYGDIGASAGDADGLFHNDTRFLSHLELLVNGEQPLLLGSTLRDDNTLLSIDLTNPDFFVDGRISRGRSFCGAAGRTSAWRCATTATTASAFRSPCFSAATSPTCSKCEACTGRAAAAPSIV
jgi:hypothetical protein